ncbi:MAG: SH3 domain-containing protein [Candidatus Eisenbacteria bacterium]|nr:SH3 domain-containing protein [Candidatus Eisenbacteria bacterium]
MRIAIRFRVRAGAGALLLAFVLHTTTHAEDAPATGAPSAGAPSAEVPSSVAPSVAPPRDWPEIDPLTLGETRQRVRIVGANQNVLRSGPGESFSLVMIAPQGADFEVIAKNGDWYNVRISTIQTGWIHAALCRSYEDLSGLELQPNPRLYSRTGCFMLTGYTGGYAFDRKSNSLALGGRVGYYLFDFLEFEGGVAWTRVHRPREVVESLFDLELEAERFSMLFYQMNVRAELLPGRRMVPYLTGGVGSSLLQGKSESGPNFGAGTLLFWNKRTAMRWECRDYRFHLGVGRSRRLHNNLEFSLGTSVLL